MTARQGKVFDRVAKEVVDGALQGYNGTIFAYGQTGSGKTYTMRGSESDYEGRGIIPRTFEYLFQEITRRATEQITVYGSFLQIYNNVGYDLCPQGKSKQYKKLDDLEKIIHRQDSEGQTHLINLTVHHLRNRAQAFGMVEEGQTNRIICKTPMNDESTRSHCIFKIIIQTRKNGSDIKTISTIHLVDLSGSQRIKNTEVTGQMQYEARSINLTLHYLQRVITCLNEKIKGSNIVVPYRDSLLTMILKNSLGGNCRTKMIATISARERDLQQTISTCEFSKRIACIKNSVYKNQSVDPQVIITRLRNQNSQLKAELALLKGEDEKDFLDEYDIQDVHKKVDNYVNSNDNQVVLVFNDRLKIQQCFSYFKVLIKSGGKFSSGENENASLNKKFDKQQKLGGAQREKYQEELKKLRLLNMRQQQEIVILITQIKKYSKPDQSTIINSHETEEQRFYKEKSNLDNQMKQNSDANFKASNASTLNKESSLLKSQWQQSRGIKEAKEAKPEEPKKSKALIQKQQIDKLLLKPHNLSPQQMLDQTKLCEQFRKSYKKQDIIKKNQTLLKQKIIQGKECHNIIKKIKQEIAVRKNKLQQLRQEMLIDNMNNRSEEVPEHPEQAKIVSEINHLKEEMKTNVNILRGLKAETEGLEDLLKRNHETFNRDLQRYLQFVHSQTTQAMKGVDRSLLVPSIEEDQVHKALLSYQKKRQEIRER